MVYAGESDTDRAIGVPATRASVRRNGDYFCASGRDSQILSMRQLTHLPALQDKGSCQEAFAQIVMFAVTLDVTVVTQGLR